MRKLILNLFIGNGCGYSNETIDYPYIYWPAPDVTALTSQPTEAFKYAVCVKSCPNADAIYPVDCKQPTFFETGAKFKDCQYYPTAYDLGITKYWGDPLRYNTTLCKHFSH
jgi:hypothetical protein